MFLPHKFTNAKLMSKKISLDHHPFHMALKKKYKKGQTTSIVFDENCVEKFHPSIHPSIHPSWY
jgi:hypothetical protein